MQYQVGLFRIACQNDVSLSVEGVEGVGSGLCYHYSVSIPGLLVLTDIASGKALPGAYATSEEQAQKLLEKIAIHFIWAQIVRSSEQQAHLTQYIAKCARSLGAFVVYI